jgi:hypothetical protein
MAGLNKVQPGFNELCRLYEAGKSLPEIERETGIPRSTVRNRLVRAGYQLRGRVDAAKASGKLGQHVKGKTLAPYSATRRQSISVGRLRWADANAVGVSLKPSGYIAHTRGPDKDRHVHVTIMEARIGRRLLADEAVHHIDGNKTNNSLNNLALVTTSGHARLHRREEQLAKKGKCNGGS